MSNYCFPNFLADFMKKVSIRTQYEASMMSMIFILCGMIIFSTYLVIWGPLGFFTKLMITINTVAGFVFISSYLITTFQQYQQLLMVNEIQSGGEEENE